MTFLKIIAPIGILLLLVNPCFSSSEKYISKELHRQALFNHSVLNMARDTSVFLYSLDILRQENAGAEVVNFMEYQLDGIVCAAEERMEKMNPYQKELTLKFIKEIKKYRAIYPRQSNIRIDPTKFSKYFEPFNKSYAERADNFFGSLN